MFFKWTIIPNFIMHLSAKTNKESNQTKQS